MSRNKKYGKGTPINSNAPVIARIKEVESPIMGVFRGWRMEAALENMEGNMFGRPCMSFRAPWHIFSHGDFEHYPSNQQKLIFEKVLARKGYINVTWRED